MHREKRARSKKIYDAVHGFIRFNDLEKGVIDSEPFQRLHGILDFFRSSSLFSVMVGKLLAMTT